MKRITTSLITAFVLCSLVALYSIEASAQSVQYTVSDLGVIGSGPSSYATAINNLGQVVGYADTYTRYSHAFLYTGSGPLVNLGSFGGDYSVSVATAINNSGMVVGYSDTGSGGTPQHAFLYTQTGGMQDLGTLGGAASEALAINNSGQIVGWAGTSNGNTDGFIYSGNGPMTDLGPTYMPMCINDAGLVVAIAGSFGNNNSVYASTYVSSGGTGSWLNIGSLGGTETQPAAVNNRGEVVGFSTTSVTEQPHAFLYSGGAMIDLGTFGGDTSYALGVNDDGAVVGYSALPGDLVAHAFIYYGSGAIQDLNNLIDPSLGWTLGGAEAINDSGQIAADGYQEGGYYHALLLTPVPEPSSLCLVTAAVLAVLATRLIGRLLRN